MENVGKRSLSSARQKTLDFAPKAASCHRSPLPNQPKIRLYMQVFGSNWPLTIHGRTNFKISGIESQLRETEQSRKAAARRSHYRSCRCKPMQIQRENRQRDRRNRRLHAYEHGRDHVVRGCLSRIQPQDAVVERI